MPKIPAQFTKGIREVVIAIDANCNEGIYVNGILTTWDAVLYSGDIVVAAGGVPCILRHLTVLDIKDADFPHSLDELFDSGKYSIEWNHFPSRSNQCRS